MLTPEFLNEIDKLHAAGWPFCTVRIVDGSGSIPQIVGAHAVAYYAEPRYTKDLDIFVRPTQDNANRIWAALARFGAPLQNITPHDFCRPDVIYQIGVEPNRYCYVH